MPEKGFLMMEVIITQVGRDFGNLQSLFPEHPQGDEIIKDKRGSIQFSKIARQEHL